MTDDRFETLVHALEQQAAAHPRLYKIRVVLLALAGNLYLFVMVFLLCTLMLALCAATAKLKALGIKLLIALGVFLWMVLKALWVKLDPPTGMAITAAQAPRLFALIDDLRVALDAPHLHRVLITDEYNAGVVQFPRLGVFGWQRNYLLIGLPLMKTLSTDQFRAVLAHEFGHLAKGHGKTTAWVYCQRLRWHQLMTALEGTQSRGRFLFMPFLTRFAPYFSAYSFPMARAKEYEADAAAARLTSPQTTAEALTLLAVVEHYLAERFWPDVYRQSDDQATPTRWPHASLASAVSHLIPPEDAHAWMSSALGEATNVSDTHPSLQDRIRALRASAAVAQPAEGQTAEALLGDQLEPITVQLDQTWWSARKASWEAHYKQVQADRECLSELDARMANGGALSLDEAYNRARLTDQVGHRTEDAIAQLRELYRQYPENAKVCFGLGAHLLNQNSPEGIGLLERTMSLEPQAISACCERIRDYHWHNGRKEEAQSWHTRLIDRQKIEAVENEERNRVSLGDTFEPHGLSEEILAPLLKQLQSVSSLRKAYLVRKKTTNRPKDPCYVFGFHITPRLHLYTLLRVEKAIKQIQESVTFPGETIIINVEGENVRFERKLRKVKGARLV